jgi:hypothetical protein
VFLDVPLGSLQSCDCLIKNGDSWMDVAWNIWDCCSGIFFL